MLNLIPPEGATEEQLDAFVASLRQEARAHVRELLAAGAPEMEILDYIASIEPTEADSITPTAERDRA
ncbi:MAG TPA: hypothetical protein VET26_11305 [Candidatus Sulfotelmatobacter sp.]|nr:hypothetical protein [Candidatus Sulfotelmatobacter sp.]